MIELVLEFFLEDGSPHPAHTPQAAYVCREEDLSWQARKYTKLTYEDEYSCGRVHFESEWECQFSAPGIVAYWFSGFHNGSESEPIYGVRWSCKSPAIG